MMIDFDEEVAKFRPATEITDAEEVILKNDLTDITDVINKLMNGGERRDV